MIFDNQTVENDPFLIEYRRDLTKLEKAKDATYKVADANPDDDKARIAYDAALLRWVHAKYKYEQALKAVIGL